MTQYNLRNPAVKRLMRETEELKNPTEDYYAQPLEDNLFEWHFTIRGPPNTEFEGGIYHGRITLPSEYPMKPPSIILLTPNGRFETNKKICLSISGHHPESWQPSWSIRTALLAIIGFLPTHGNGAIGSLDYTPEERKNLALKSQVWKCSECGLIKNCLKSSEAKSSMKYDVPKAKSSIEPDVPVTESSKNYVQNVDSSTELNVQKLESTIELCIHKVETVSLFSDGEKVTESDISFAQDTHSGKIFNIENVSMNTLRDDCTDLPSVIMETEITAIENTPTIRQRNVVSCGLSAESEQSDNIISEHPANSLHNYVSLVMIWVISVILFILIVRRWLAYDSL